MKPVLRATEHPARERSLIFNFTLLCKEQPDTLQISNAEATNKGENMAALPQTATFFPLTN
jgi:hypothetical protein